MIQKELKRKPITKGGMGIRKTVFYLSSDSSTHGIVWEWETGDSKQEQQNKSSSSYTSDRRRYVTSTTRGGGRRRG